MTSEERQSLHIPCPSTSAAREPIREPAGGWIIWNSQDWAQEADWLPIERPQKKKNTKGKKKNWREQKSEWKRSLHSVQHDVASFSQVEPGGTYMVSGSSATFGTLPPPSGCCSQDSSPLVSGWSPPRGRSNKTSSGRRSEAWGERQHG